MKSELNVYDMVDDMEYNKIVKARKSLPRVVDEGLFLIELLLRKLNNLHYLTSLVDSFIFIADEFVEDDDCELFDDGEGELQEEPPKTGSALSSGEEDSNSAFNYKEGTRRKKDLRDMLVSSSKNAPIPAKQLRFVCTVRFVSEPQTLNSVYFFSVLVGGACVQEWNLV